MNSHYYHSIHSKRGGYADKVLVRAREFYRNDRSIILRVGTVTKLGPNPELKLNYWLTYFLDPLIELWILGLWIDGSVSYIFFLLWAGLPLISTLLTETFGNSELELSSLAHRGIVSEENPLSKNKNKLIRWITVLRALVHRHSSLCCTKY